MKRVFGFLLLCLGLTNVAWAQFVSCGAGYVLDKHADIDGIHAAECKKLWCRDLENGKIMGSGDKASNGYRLTSSPVELCDADNNCIECFGERRWCNGAVAGQWNPEYGAYTRGGDNTTYLSYQKGNCFAWQLEKPECPDGETAILKDEKWICAVPSSNNSGVSRASSVRRTGAMRRIKR